MSVDVRLCPQNGLESRIVPCRLWADSVEKLKSRRSENLANVAHWRLQPLQGSVEPIRAPAIIFAVVDVVAHPAARETHQQS